MNFKAILSTLALTTTMLTFTHNTPVFASEQNVAPAIQGTPTINLELKNTSRPFVQLVSNVVYAQVPDRGYTNKPLTMHLVIPQDKKPHPVILYINGGGFINANKDGYMQQWLDLAEHGYVVASMTYRVAPTSTFPAPLEDVKSAVRFLRANAEKFHIDAKHIGVFGGKDGGINANPEGAKAANPLIYISKKTAPFLLMHGDADFLVSPSQTELLREELAKHNIEATRYLVKGAAHGGPYWVQPEIMDIVIAFYDKHLKK